MNDLVKDFAISIAKALAVGGVTYGIKRVSKHLAKNKPVKAEFEYTKVIGFTNMINDIKIEA